jgi:transcriptional regulator with XRE-family HTH domain
VSDWNTVGTLMRARMTQLAMDQQDVVNVSGVSRGTVGPILNGEGGNYRPKNLAKICAALGWTPDSIDRILEGREPAELSPQTDELTEALAAFDRASRALTEAIARHLHGSPAQPD